MSERAEVWLGRLLVLVLVLLHGVNFISAGPLWRDEANSATIAALPSWSQAVEHFQFDSFPALWFVILRAWTGVFGVSDLAFRGLALVASLLVLAALWWLARLFRVRAPLIALGLYAFCVDTVIYGDSVRAYGLGMAAGLWMLGMVWLLTRGLTPTRVVGGLVAALAAAQLIYYGSVFIFAAGTAGMIVALRRRELARVGAIAAICALAALSYLPYRDMFHAMDFWNELVKYPVDLSWVFMKFREAVHQNGRWAVPAWLLLAAAAVAAAAFAQSRERTPDLGDDDRDGALYCGLVIAIGSVAYVAFLLQLRYYMSPWYYLILLAMVGGSLDGALRAAIATPRGALVRAVLATVMALASLQPLLGMVVQRRTNVDALARAIEQQARPGDFVVVNPWYLGVTFNRYYHGAAAWETVPPLADHSVHRYDLFKRQMMVEDAARPVLEAAEAALKAGHRVFVVGQFAPLPRNGQAPAVYAHQPGAPFLEDPAENGWGQQVSTFLDRGATKIQGVDVGPDRPTNYYEHMGAVVLQGWAHGS